MGGVEGETIIIDDKSAALVVACSEKKNRDNAETESEVKGLNKRLEICLIWMRNQTHKERTRSYINVQESIILWL